VKRVSKEIGGNSKWMLIERRQCTTASCRKTHRLLPDISVPYKHYEAGVIEDVIDGTINEDALCEETYPSESTLQRWRLWAEQFLKDAEGKLRSAAYRILDLSDEFLGTGESLLEAFKERLSYGWLSLAVRVYINTG
jgi:hypothetical protein